MHREKINLKVCCRNKEIKTETGDFSCYKEECCIEMEILEQEAIDFEERKLKIGAKSAMQIGRQENHHTCHELPGKRMEE